MNMTTRLMTSIARAWFGRVTRSPVATAFFVFVLANCIAQSTLYAVLISTYGRDRDLVTSTIDATGVQRGFTVVRQGALEICSGIPTVHGTTCYTVYNSSVITTPTSTLSVQCAEGLTWLEDFLHNTKSEEVVCLILQISLAVLSLIALIDESIPHLIVVLAVQVVNTSWISYRIVDNISEKRIYDEIIVDGTCGASDILGGSWQLKTSYVTLGFNIVALLCIIFFVLNLAKLYSRQTLASVGSPPVINRLLKRTLWVQVFLQLTSFFTLASAAVLYDKRKSDMIAPYSTNILFDASFYIVVIILPWWYALGTYSISKEKRLLYLVHALMSISLLVVSGLWFGSALFRYEYGAWHAFACVTTLADVLLVITCILSFVCRVNFGRGLAHFLVVRRKLQTSGFPHDIFPDANRSGRGRRPGINTGKTSTSHLAIDPSCSSFETSKHRSSACSVDSAVLSMWLASNDSKDLERYQLQTMNVDELETVVVISRETTSLYGARSRIPDDENDSEYESDEAQLPS